MGKLIRKHIRKHIRASTGDNKCSVFLILTNQFPKTNSLVVTILHIRKERNIPCSFVSHPPPPCPPPPTYHPPPPCPPPPTASPLHPQSATLLPSLRSHRNQKFSSTNSEMPSHSGYF